MGTNFYAKYIPSEDDFKEIEKLAKERNLVELQKFLNKFDEEIHIGKRSCGWKFSFDHNWGKYYELTRVSIDEFLHTPGIGIEDEYGELMSPKEFWEMVDDWNNDPHNNFVSKTYEEYEKSRDPHWHTYLCTSDIEKCKEVFGIETNDNDFESDGLRFPVFSDFS